MKKFIYLFITAMVICAGVSMSSCSKEGDDIITPEEKPDEKIEMGYYELHFENIYINNWPDSKSLTEEAYLAYQKNVIDALKIDTNKEYKWSDIEAEKARVQKAFDDIKGFEYKVKAALNIINYHGGITLKAYKKGQSEAEIDFGKKEITCIKEIPEGTSQLYMVIESAEAAAPSAKEYCQKVRTLFADALKEVFTDDFAEVKGAKEMLNFYNLANVPGDRDKLVEELRKVCEKVEVPALSDEIMQKAKEEFPKMNYLLKVDLTSYDPFYYAPSKSDSIIYLHWFGEVNK